MSNERLVEFLYILGRDHLALGVLEDIMWDHVDGTEDSYCNSFLEDYARDLAERLTDDTLPITDWKHMYKKPGIGDEPGERYYIRLDGTHQPAPYTGKVDN
jgi:hypothetical protein